MRFMQTYAATAALLAVSTFVRANVADQTIYETASMGAAGASSGTIIDSQEYLGVRFQISQPVTIDAIGGHFGTLDSVGSSIFGAIIHLDSLSDFPDSINPLNSSDVLGTTLLTLPASSADLTAPIGPLNLGPGTYALLFGTGQLGATGNAFAASDNVNEGTHSEFSYQEVNGIKYADTSFTNARFEVLGQVPEPAEFLPAIVGALMATSFRFGLRTRQ